MHNIITKITESNKFSSTALIAFVLLAGCLLMLNSDGESAVLYTGLALIVITTLLTIDAYYKASIKEHYESIIKNLNNLLKDSRSENRQVRTLINDTFKTGSQEGQNGKDYKELVE